MCAFLAPDAIPEELLVEVLKTPLPSSGSPEQQQRKRGGWFSWFTSGRRKKPEPALAPAKGGQIDEAVAILRAYSLIQRNATEKTLSVHRLVQAVLRDSMSTVTQQQWMQRAVQAVDTAFPAIEFANWPRCERLLPHALTCATWIEQASIVTSEATGLLNQAGVYLDERGRYGEAEPLYVHALAICEHQLGAEHLDTDRSLNNLAGLYQNQGKYVQAEPLYVRALAICEQQLGPEHLDTVTSLNNLALLYGHQGKYEKAELLYQRALTIREQQLGPEHLDTALNLDNLALLYQKQGKYVEAERLFQRALTIREQHLGQDHPLTRTVNKHYAALLRTMRRDAEAEQLEVKPE